MHWCTLFCSSVHCKEPLSHYSAFNSFLIAFILGLMALRVIVGMIGKLGISVSFDAIYTWSVELHPTIIRYAFIKQLRFCKFSSKLQQEKK